MVPGTWYLISGTRYLISGTRYLINLINLYINLYFAYIFPIFCGNPDFFRRNRLQDVARLSSQTRLKTCIEVVACLARLVASLGRKVRCKARIRATHFRQILGKISKIFDVFVRPRGMVDRTIRRI